MILLLLLLLFVVSSLRHISLVTKSIQFQRVAYTSVNYPERRSVLDQARRTAAVSGCTRYVQLCCY